MKILLTGAGGFIGRHLVKALLAKNYRLRCLVRKGSQTGFLPGNVEKFTADLTYLASLNGICTGIDVVIHGAALTNVKDLKTEGHRFKEINVTGTENLLKQSKGIKKFIYLSSVDAMGINTHKVLSEEDKCRPVQPYDRSKYEGELLVKGYASKYGFTFTILRPSMVYGGGVSNPEILKVDRAILKFMKLIRKHVFPIFGSGKNKLPLVHVSNVVQAVMRVIENTTSTNQTYIISDKRSYELNELVETIAKELNVKYSGFHVPLPVAYTGAFFFEKIKNITGIDFGITRKSIDYITANRVFNVTKAMTDLNYNPIDLKAGINEAVSWYKKNGYL
ncbi:hypothetical protein A2716_02490 [candidate division WWE3 bacterium RIFCSPHIGHO2_01_FULL_40_23]|uniref:NAD-dependent epimerase/dehydratase domain-containing protein n=1 Tax=candidate division WWE3 bacterium RIFCSPLOWO2_01_FULL_41_18 TaxID=1802625 RepID=A0A1F4VFB4_UNCKA|nr:MAG: hypothetical protein A2716_02490 [candidate division WWE3 bacterium RIFCSPHIGHO2_01_FULL_40_23]OGC55854.1 MAG: hypothetical protein A3A78_02340 [candidate division WWE3 bacterium RIFCSPLOWO2_01_FULL_41_18]